MIDNIYLTFFGTFRKKSIKISVFFHIITKKRHSFKGLKINSVNSIISVDYTLKRCFLENKKVLFFAKKVSVKTILLHYFCNQ